MKKNKKKLLCILFVIVILFFVYLILPEKNVVINSKNKSDRVVVTTFLIANKNKTKKNDKIVDVAHSDNVLNSLRTSFKLKKKDKFYTTSIDDVNPLLLNNISDYVFSLNDYNGNVINDAEFDIKTKTIKIPEKYFKEYNSKFPVQFEILSLVTPKDLKNVKINVEKNRKNSSIFVDGNDTSISFSFKKYKKGKNILKKDINIFLNNSKTALESSRFEWDSTAGTISIAINPLVINNIKVTTNKKNIFSFIDNFIIKIKNASALSYSKMEAYYKELAQIDTAYDWSNYSTTGNYTLWYYDSTGGSNYSAVFPNTTEGNARKKAYDDGIDYVCRTNGNCGEEAAAYHSFILDLSNVDLVSPEVQIGTDKDGNPIKTKYHIKFKNNTYVSLFCISHSEGANVSGNSAARNITITVKKYKPNKYIVLEFKSNNRLNTQVADGVVKFDWTQDLCNVTVTKHWAENGTEISKNSNGVKVTLYTDDNCTEKYKTKTISNGSSVTWKNLEFDTYSIKETDMGGNSLNDWTNTTGCKKFTLNANDKKSDGTCMQTVNTNNRRRYYCLKVKKVDAETGGNLGNIQFSLNTGVAGTTDANGEITYNYLPYNDYSVTETSSDGTLGYWNDYVTNSRTLSVPAGNLTEMGYSGNTWTDIPNTCSASSSSYVKKDHKQYYCLKVKKVDKVTGALLKGASFSTTIAGAPVTKKDSDDGADDGVTSFFLGTNSGTYSVVEQEAPVGYAKDDRTLQANAVLLPRELTYSQAQSACLKADAVDANGNNITAQSIIFKNSKYVINWYKVTENKETKANGALFKVKNVDTNEYITVSNPEAQTDDSNPTITKSCYKYTGTGTTDQNSGTAMVSMNVRTTINGVATDTNGEVCVSGLPKGNYKVEEIQPAQYHTFGSTTEATVSTSTTFKAMDDTNKFINYPTRFEFGKNIVSSYSSTDEGSYKDLTTSELRKLKFNVTDVSGQIVRFKKKRDANNNVIEGEYEYLNNTINPQGEEEVTDLQLNSDRKIIIWHLPWADASNTNGALYSIKEKVEDGCTDQNQNTCNGNGFYYPEYNNPSDFQFRIYQTSSPQSINKTEPKQSLSNTPTEIKFTKDDIYCKDSNCNSNYQNGTNGTKQDTVFENEEEMKVFDDIQFVLRDSTGRDVTDHLIKVSDNEYRFVKDVNTLSDELKAKLVKTDSSVVGNNLHTKDGTLKITHLCRESTYYIEEYRVPEHTVFILPTTIQFNGTVPSNWNWQGHPYVTYKVSNKESTKKTTPYSDTQVIDNTPTRVLIYKKDSKYDYLIPDETTTFQLYRCKKGEECHPTDDPDNTENYERVRFWNRALIPGDKEDSSDNKTGLHTEVYKFVSTSDEKSMSESDLKSKTTYDLHPDHGVLVFRYLPANYNYVLVETVAPKNYQLPVGRNAETSFKVVDNTVEVDEKDLPNKPTSVLIKKYANDGKLLKGAEFKIYEVEDSNVCSKNLSPVNQKKKLLKLKTIRDGVYEARPEGDTDTIVTCSDRDDAKCSDIKTFVSKELTTKLTHDKYENSWSNFEDKSTSTAEGRQIELQEGVALIQYLEYDHCYVIEETKAPEGYSLPELKKRYTTITIKKNDEFAHDTNKDLINSPTPFKFYKYDEFNKLIDGAEFKLQKLDNNKKYQDVTVTEIPTENGELFYKVDKDTDNTLIMTKGGTATIYYLTAGQYRVVETKAPDGKELSKNLNLATFFVDENGSVYGNSIIANKSITLKTPAKNSASAELIVTIQTGQTIIRYGLVIAVLVGMISGLMILKEKKSRKDYNKDEK